MKICKAKTIVDMIHKIREILEFVTQEINIYCGTNFAVYISWIFI